VGEHPSARASEVTPGPKPNDPVRVDQDQLLTLPEPGPPPQLGRQNETPALPEANRVGIRVGHIEECTTRLSGTTTSQIMGQEWLCGRSILDLDPGELQARLLDTYAVEVLPLEHVAPLFRLPRTPDPPPYMPTIRAVPAEGS